MYGIILIQVLIDILLDYQGRFFYILIKFDLFQVQIGFVPILSKSNNIMAPKIYYMAASPPCRAVYMTAKAIGLEIELETVDREQLRTDEMLELNPQHTAPILVDADEDFTIWDSHAIMIYFVGQYAGSDDSLYPKDNVKKAAVINQRLHFDNLLHQRLRDAFTPIIMGIEEDISEEARDGFLEALGILEIFLKDYQWMAGDDITIADLSILAFLSTVETVLPLDPERFPKLTNWFGRAKELPYFEECNGEGLDQIKEMLKREVPLI
ncbi:unnamed protein product [Ceutorhynchus assimilis]|uniref:Uncharacterized protein n=1 Tax=Ceutorhynchus assimilis TaxID=467358 RepID=A0A9N9MN24_9CUCU|nr:unnamed protein product [Ceutorhynchus assimilis]